MSTPLQENLEIGRFVRAHRITHPALASDDSGRRRRHVPHMTQTELASLIGVSTVVISQIEQGRYPNLTRGVLRRIATALEFPTQDEIYLLGLLNKRTKVQRGREAAPDWIIESVGKYAHPAMVVNPAYDIMAMNPATSTMLGSHSKRFSEIGNVASAVFRFAEMRQFFTDWQCIARGIVSGMRMGYSVHPDFRQHVSDLAHRLARESEFFHTHWNQENPLVDSPIENSFLHPELGMLNLILMTTVIVEAPHLTMLEFLPADEESRIKLTQQLS